MEGLERMERGRVLAEDETFLLPPSLPALHFAAPGSAASTSPHLAAP